MTAETSNARGEAEYEYEVWQGNAWQAGGSTTDYASAQSEAGHYAMMYAPDGPVEVRIYEKRLLAAAPPPAARGDVRAVLQEMRDRQVARRFKSQTLTDWADRIEAAIAAEGVQAGEVEQRARDLLQQLASIDDPAGRVVQSAHNGRWFHEDAVLRAIVAALSQQPDPKPSLARTEIDRANQTARVYDDNGTLRQEWNKGIFREWDATGRPSVIVGNVDDVEKSNGR